MYLPTLYLPRRNRGEQAFSERVTDLGVVKKEQTALKTELQMLKVLRSVEM